VIQELKEKLQSNKIGKKLNKILHIIPNSTDIQQLKSEGDETEFILKQIMKN